MPIVETERRLSRRSTGWRRALSNDLDRLVRSRKANTFCSKDDGLVPNHPHWNLIVDRGPVKPPEQFDPAAIFQDFTDATALGSSCLNGIYDYVHYRSHIPEVLGLARGSGKLQFGGRWSRTLSLEAGDIALLFAGTGHHCLDASDDFLVVGACPPKVTYDECTESKHHSRAVRIIPEVARSRGDQVYGKGPTLHLWQVGG